MRLKVRFFSSLRQATGCGELTYDFARCTTDELWGQLCQQFPELCAFTSSRAIAVNLKHVGPDQVLHDGDEVAFFPPVSGG